MSGDEYDLSDVYHAVDRMHDTLEGLPMLTRREQFAAAALAGMIDSGAHSLRMMAKSLSDGDLSPADVLGLLAAREGEIYEANAKAAVKQADALIDALDESTP